MTSIAWGIANAVAIVVLPWPVIGLINRTKALWSGRRGPPLLQSLHDVRRLLRKTPVYSSVTTPLFRVTPWIGLGASLLSAALVPVAGGAAIVSFDFDFIALAYLWGLGRAALMLGALDTGSSFEGMGAAREATFAALVEPALLLVLGALTIVTGEHSLAGALVVPLGSAPAVVVWAACAASLAIVVQAEAARMPVDDPTTHLELTMIHEVMVLDHSGPDLAAVQATAGLKLTLGLALIATLLNPFASGSSPALALLGNVVLIGFGAVAVGTVESLMARLQLRVVPRYLLLAAGAGAVAVLATTWQGVAS
jgi:formate hydrogenlyase subunit 4